MVFRILRIGRKLEQSGEGEEYIEERSGLVSLNLGVVFKLFN